MSYQITAVEELNALPEKTIVMDAHGRGFQKFNNRWEPTGLGETFSRCATPATVLHIPGEPEHVALVGGRRAGKTEALIEDILERAAVRGLHISLQYGVPTREEVELAVGRVLFDASNHPDPVAVLGRDFSPLRTKVVDAVMEILEQ